MQTMRDQIVARIHRLGEGKAFSAKDFLDIGSRTTVDVTLASLTKEGKIRRKTEALADLPLLAQVVKHKETFYPSAWSRYDSAHPAVNPFSWLIQREEDVIFDPVITWGRPER